LQDDPKAWWDTDLVAKTVQDYTKRWKVDAIITFDDGGVSGHINHRAVAAGVRHWALSSSIPAFQLTTVFVLRKYTILLDLPAILLFALPRLIWTTIFGDEHGHWGLMVASPSMYFTARKAFEQHASQVVWDRYLICKLR
jgi:N-acetylglucosaminylphosphatidylinositol deacetylase